MALTTRGSNTNNSLSVTLKSVEGQPAQAAQDRRAEGRRSRHRRSEAVSTQQGWHAGGCLRTRWAAASQPSSAARTNETSAPVRWIVPRTVNGAPVLCRLPRRQGPKMKHRTVLGAGIRRSPAAKNRFFAVPGTPAATGMLPVSLHCLKAFAAPDTVISAQLPAFAPSIFRSPVLFASGMGGDFSCPAVERPARVQVRPALRTARGTGNVIRRRLRDRFLSFSAATGGAALPRPGSGGTSEWFLGCKTKISETRGVRLSGLRWEARYRTSRRVLDRISAPSPLPSTDIRRLLLSRAPEVHPRAVISRRTRTWNVVASSRLQMTGWRGKHFTESTSLSSSSRSSPGTRATVVLLRCSRNRPTPLIQAVVSRCFRCLFNAGGRKQSVAPNNLVQLARTRSRHGSP